MHCNAARFMAGCPTLGLRLHCRTPLLLGSVHQIFVMGKFRRPAVQSQIIPAGCLQALMPQDLLDMADGTAIEQQQRGGGMPQKVGSNSLLDLCRPSVSGERPPDVGAAQAGTA